MGKQFSSLYESLRLTKSYHKDAHLARIGKSISLQTVCRIFVSCGKIYTPILQTNPPACCYLPLHHLKSTVVQW
jgi:hypothetical protein